MYFLRSAKNLLSEKALKALYYALVHCHLIYGILIWSFTSFSNLKGLEKKQKDALFKRLNILPIQQLILYFKIQFMQQYKFNHLPSAFSNEWTTNEERFTNQDLMPLRNNDDFFVPFARTGQAERFFALPKIWNEFPDIVIKCEANKLIFNSKLKEYFLDKLNANFVCSRLLCPHCHLNNRAIPLN
jgi:hypothetical protein